MRRRIAGIPAAGDQTAAAERSAGVQRNSLRTEPERTGERFEAVELEARVAPVGRVRDPEVVHAFESNPRCQPAAADLELEAHTDPRHRDRGDTAEALDDGTRGEREGSLGGVGVGCSPFWSS